MPQAYAGRGKTFPLFKKIMKEEKFTVEIISNRKETPEMHLIHLEKPSGFVYKPGQFIQVSIIGSTHSSNFSIASHPDDHHIELLINSGGVNACKVCALPVGSSLHISPPIGPGFPIEKLAGKTIYLVTHGSGISAFKALIEEMRKKRNQYGQIRLVYGVRTPEDFAFKKLLRDWMGSLEVYDIISKNPGDLKIWTGEIGHVQHVLQKLQPSPENAVCAISGSEKMETEVMEIFKNFGFAPEQILKNH
jgi:NAD(P)H-flavin reductase